jgi:hypothetical protein
MRVSVLSECYLPCEPSFRSKFRRKY